MYTCMYVCVCVCVCVGGWGKKRRNYFQSLFLIDSLSLPLSLSFSLSSWNFHISTPTLIPLSPPHRLSLSYDSSSGGEREIQRTMLELLTRLDGFDSRGDVKVTVENVWKK